MSKNADVSRLAYIGFLMDLSNGWQVGSSVYYRYRSPSHARHEGSMPMAIGIDPSWLASDSLRPLPDAPDTARHSLLAMRGLSRWPAAETPHGSPLIPSAPPYLPFLCRSVCYLLLKIHNYPHF